MNTPSATAVILPLLSLYANADFPLLSTPFMPPVYSHDRRQVLTRSQPSLSYWNFQRPLVVKNANTLLSSAPFPALDVL